MDFTSLVPYAVTAVETLLFSIPSKIKFSPSAKEPLILYAVIIPEFVAAYLRKPVAPLAFPLICVGVSKVIFSFKVISVYV